MSAFATTDLCDDHADLQVCEPIFLDFGGAIAFAGPIKTLKVFEDNALVGGNIGALAEKNDWAGVVVNGCVRDSEELAEQEVGIKALATHPRKSEKGLHTGHVDRVVEFAGVRFVPGAWLYADADGIVVAESAVHKG